MAFLSLVRTIKESKKISIICLAIICSGVGVYSYPNITSHDTYPDYYVVEKPYLDTCSLTKIPKLSYNWTDNQTGKTFTAINEDARNPLKWYMDCAGTKIFQGYDNVLPFIFSIGIIISSYKLAFVITKQRLAGILTSAFLAMNPLFFMWNDTVTYGQAWAFFLNLGIWLSYKLPLASPFAYGLSIVTKGLSLAYLPMFLYTMVKSRKNFEDIALPMIVTFLITLTIAAIALSTIGLVGAKVSFHPENIIDGLYRTFGIIVWDLPILFGFFAMEIMFRKHSPPILGKDISFVWMGGICLVSILVYIFTSQAVFPYRFVPFAVFMSLYIGIVLTRITYCFEYLAIRRMNAKHRE